MTTEQCRLIAHDLSEKVHHIHICPCAHTQTHMKAHTLSRAHTHTVTVRLDLELCSVCTHFYVTEDEDLGQSLPMAAIPNDPRDTLPHLRVAVNLCIKHWCQLKEEHAGTFEDDDEHEIMEWVNDWCPAAFEAATGAKANPPAQKK